jgi:hypothetical protein
MKFLNGQVSKRVAIRGFDPDNGARINGISYDRAKQIGCCWNAAGMNLRDSTEQDFSDHVAIEVSTKTEVALTASSPERILRRHSCEVCTKSRTPFGQWN